MAKTRRLVKRSLAAKRRMAQLRRLAVKARKQRERTSFIRRTPRTFEEDLRSRSTHLAGCSGRHVRGLCVVRPARRNFPMPNPAENPSAMDVARAFVNGATRGVASNLYIHGNRIYSYGPHFPIAEWREGEGIFVTTRRSPSQTTSKQIGMVKRAIAERGITARSAELAPEAAVPAGYSNPLTFDERAELYDRQIRDHRSAGNFKDAGKVGPAEYHRGRADVYGEVANEFQEKPRARRNFPMPNAARHNPMTCDNPRHQHVVVWQREPGVNDTLNTFGSRSAAQSSAREVRLRYGGKTGVATLRNPLLQMVSLANPAKPPRAFDPMIVRVLSEEFRYRLDVAKEIVGVWRQGRGKELHPKHLSDLREATKLARDLVSLRSRIRSRGAKRGGRRNPVPMPNPSVRVPFRAGQKIPVAKAWAWVQATGDRELIAQFKKAWELQKKANKDPKYVYWRTIPIGSSKTIEMVTAMAHYGNSPETYYTPPKGSKKGARTLFRHRWGDAGGGKRSVPLLAAASGKALIMPLDGKKVAGDWLRH